MLTALLGLLQSLPELIKIGKALFKFAQDQQLKSYLVEVEKTIGEIERAKTPQEKQTAAAALAKLISRM